VTLEARKCDDGWRIFAEAASARSEFCLFRQAGASSTLIPSARCEPRSRQSEDGPARRPAWTTWPPGRDTRHPVVDHRQNALVRRSARAAASAGRSIFGRDRHRLASVGTMVLGLRCLWVSGFGADAEAHWALCAAAGAHRCQPCVRDAMMKPRPPRLQKKFQNHIVAALKRATCEVAL
jgi:hypothetical protein